MQNAKANIEPGSPISYQAFLREWLALFENQVNSLDVEKSTDFMDRIDRVICIPPASNELLGDDGAQKEILDMAFILVHKNFRQTTHVQKAVIDVLSSMLDAGGSKRTAEKIVFSSHGPKDSRFGFSQLSAGDQERFAWAKETAGWDKFIKLDRIKAEGAFQP